MPYNLRKKSIKSIDLTDDRDAKSVNLDKWRANFISILEEENLRALEIFIKNNKPFSGFDYFLMSMLPVVSSIYGDEMYVSVLEIVRNSNSNLRAKISEEEN